MLKLGRGKKPESLQPTESTLEQSTVEFSLNAEQVKTFFGRLEYVAIKLGNNIAEQIAPDATVEEIEEIAEYSLEPLAADAAEVISITEQNPLNEQVELTNLKNAFVSKFKPTVVLTAQLARASRLPSRSTKPRESLKNALETADLSLETRTQIAGSLLGPIINSYQKTSSVAKLRTARRVRNYLDFILPDPTAASKSTDPTVLGIAAVIATDRAVNEAQKAKSFAVATEKVSAAVALNSCFGEALKAQKEAAQKYIGYTPRVRAAVELNDHLSLIKNNAPETITDSDFSNLTGRLLKEIIVKGKRDGLAETYAFQEAGVPVVPTSYGEVVIVTPQTTDIQPTQQQPANDILAANEVLKNKSKHLKRNLGVAAVTTATILNPTITSANSASNEPINPGSAAGSLEIPNSQSKTLKFGFNTDEPVTDSNEVVVAEPKMGIEAGETPLAGVETGNESSLDTTGQPESATPETSSANESPEPVLGDPNIPAIIEEAENPTTTQPPDVKDDSTNSPTDGPITVDNISSENPPTDTDTNPSVAVDQEQTVALEDIFSPQPEDPSMATPGGALPQPLPETSQDPATVSVETPAVEIYAAEPTDPEAKSNTVFNLNPEQISSETPIEAPVATETIHDAQLKIQLDGKSEAHELSIELADKYFVAGSEFNANDINSYLEYLNQTSLKTMLKDIADKNEKATVKTQVDKLIAYAQLISEKPSALDNSNLKSDIDALISEVPGGYNRLPAIYPLLLKNSIDKVGSSEGYLNNASTGSADADRTIRLLTTAAVATASNEAISELPEIDPYVVTEAEQAAISAEQTSPIEVDEFKFDKSTLLNSVAENAHIDIKNQPEKLAFLKKVTLAVSNIAVKYKPDVNLEVLITQAIIETEWGKYAPHNNLYGIKAGSDWKGETFQAYTKEYQNGNLVTVLATFRAYDTPEDSVLDRMRLLGDGHANFEPGCATTPSSYLNSLQGTIHVGRKCLVRKNGVLAYATDVDYKKKIKDTIAANNLTLVLEEAGLGNYGARLYAAERSEKSNRTNRGDTSNKESKETIPHGEQVADQAREWAKNDPKCSFTDDGTCYQTCLNIVRKAWNAVGEQDGLKDYSAYDAYKRYKQNGWVSKEEPIPVGAIMWSANLEKTGWGHVYIYLGDGMVASNDVNTPGLYTITHLNDKNTIWDTHTWLGWSAYHG